MIDPASMAAEIDAIDYSGFSVAPAYIDENGHMNVGYYGVLFDKALDLVWAALGIMSPQMREAGKSSFALETHVVYKRELREGDPLDFDFVTLDFDTKRIHFYMMMSHAREGWVAALSEELSSCVDLNERRAGSWPEEVRERIAALYRAHRERPRAPEIGRAMGIRRKA